MKGKMFRFPQRTTSFEASSTSRAQFCCDLINDCRDATDYYILAMRYPYDDAAQKELRFIGQRIVSKASAAAAHLGGLLHGVEEDVSQTDKRLRNTMKFKMLLNTSSRISQMLHELSRIPFLLQRGFEALPPKEVEERLAEAGQVFANAISIAENDFSNAGAV